LFVTGAAFNKPDISLSCYNNLSTKISAQGNKVKRLLVGLQLIAILWH
jgi:hypothetical protein